MSHQDIPSKDIHLLLESWERTIDEWSRHKSSLYNETLAISAVSYSSFFSSVIDNDPLLDKIRSNFGLLEHPDDDIYGPYGIKLWERQAALIAEARSVLDISTK